jgi:hypothetical protein
VRIRYIRRLEAKLRFLPFLPSLTGLCEEVPEVEISRLGQCGHAFRRGAGLDVRFP